MKLLPKISLEIKFPCIVGYVLSVSSYPFHIFSHKPQFGIHIIARNAAERPKNVGHCIFSYPIYSQKLSTSSVKVIQVQYHIVIRKDKMNEPLVMSLMTIFNYVLLHLKLNVLHATVTNIQDSHHFL